MFTPCTAFHNINQFSGSNNCDDGDIRLNGGISQSEGIVEICFGRVWGTICDNGWDDSDAGVACRQLGYTQGHGMFGRSRDNHYPHTNINSHLN